MLTNCYHATSPCFSNTSRDGDSTIPTGSLLKSQRPAKSRQKVPEHPYIHQGSSTQIALPLPTAQIQISGSSICSLHTQDSFFFPLIFPLKVSILFMYQLACFDLWFFFTHSQYSNSTSCAPNRLLGAKYQRKHLFLQPHTALGTFLVPQQRGVSDPCMLPGSKCHKVPTRTTSQPSGSNS